MSKREFVVETYHILLVEHTLEEAKKIFKNAKSVFSIIREDEEVHTNIDKRTFQRIVIQGMDNPTKFLKGVTKAHSFSNDFTLYVW